MMKNEPFNINKDEIQYLFDIPLEYLIENHPFKTETYTYKGKQFSTLIIEYANETVWGATARITDRLIKKIKQIIETGG
jgi:hypothetical protein